MPNIEKMHLKGEALADQCDIILYFMAILGLTFPVFDSVFNNKCHIIGISLHNDIGDRIFYLKITCTREFFF